MSSFAPAPKPRVILGLMPFGPEGTGARVTSLPEFNTFLDHFQAAGYNEVDTARVYSAMKQESFTKDANWKERGLKLATKAYPGPPGAHKAEPLTNTLNTSLKELGSDSVDIFYLHAADRSVPFAETLEAVDKLHKAGKFVQFGLSNFTAFEVSEIVMICKYNNWVRPTIYEGVYNAITRSLDAELIPACRRYGLEIVTYNPLAGGLFSGKYKTKDVPTEGPYSDKVGPAGQMYRTRYFKDTTFEALQIIEPVVEKHGLTLVETALRWIINHSALNIVDGKDGLIIGVSSLAQLDQNMKDCEKGPLPQEVVDALDKAWQITKATDAPYWHLGLNYTYDTKKALE